MHFFSTAERRSSAGQDHCPQHMFLTTPHCLFPLLPLHCAFGLRTCRKFFCTSRTPPHTMNTPSRTDSLRWSVEHRQTMRAQTARRPTPHHQLHGKARGQQSTLAHTSLSFSAPKWPLLAPDMTSVHGFEQRAAKRAELSLMAPQPGRPHLCIRAGVGVTERMAAAQ